MDNPGKAPWLIAIVALVLAGAFAFLWIGERDTSSDEIDSALATEIPRAETTANEVILAITNFDAQTFESVQDDLLPLTTGPFRADYQELLDAGLGEALEQGAIDSTGEIVDGPYIGMSSSERGVAVARVVQEVTSRATPGGRTVFMVLRLDLVKEGARWKADSLDVLAQSTL
ncbi:MAG: hypothetical protein ACLGHL_08365 [Actinomycetota bacterium]